MKRVVFICEDLRGGADFFKQCIPTILGIEPPIWRGQGISALPGLAKQAQRQYGDAKIVVLADGDVLTKKPGVRNTLKQQLQQLGACGILVSGNVEALARRCVPAAQHAGFDKERSKSKANALKFAMDVVDWDTARAQPEFVDVVAVADCDLPSQSPV